MKKGPGYNFEMPWLKRTSLNFKLTFEEQRETIMKGIIKYHNFNIVENGLTLRNKT